MTKCLIDSLRLTKWGNAQFQDRKQDTEMNVICHFQWGMSVKTVHFSILVLIINRNCNLPGLHVSDYLYTQAQRHSLMLQYQNICIYVCRIGLKVITRKNCLNCPRILSYGFLNKTLVLLCILIFKISMHTQGTKLKWNCILGKMCTIY